MKSETTDFQVQTRFTNVGSSSASVTTGFAIDVPGSARVQVSIPSGVSGAATCLEQIELFENGSLVLAGIDSDGVSVTTFDEEVVVTYDAGFELHLLPREVPLFGCYFSFWAHLTPEFMVGKSLVGLMGTPNGDATDDWKDSTGAVLPMPDDDEAFFGTAYNYCVDNWCIAQESASLFTYSGGDTFASISGCNEAYDVALEAAVKGAIDDALDTICDGDIECLVDGITGGTEAATAFLEDKEATETAAIERFEEDRISMTGEESSNEDSPDASSDEDSPDPSSDEDSPDATSDEDSSDEEDSPFEQFFDFVFAPFRFVWGLIQDLIDSFFDLFT